jgi:hypothetical protein
VCQSTTSSQVGGDEAAPIAAAVARPLVLVRADGRRVDLRDLSLLADGRRGGPAGRWVARLVRAGAEQADQPSDFCW